MLGSNESISKKEIAMTFELTGTILTRRNNWEENQKKRKFTNKSLNEDHAVCFRIIVLYAQFFLPNMPDVKEFRTQR